MFFNIFTQEWKIATAGREYGITLEGRY